MTGQPADRPPVFAPVQLLIVLQGFGVTGLIVLLWVWNIRRGRWSLTRR